MKKVFLTMVLTLVSASAFAMNCKTAACEGANAVIQILESSKTPAQARNLLIAALNGPTQDQNVAILANEVVDAAVGTIYRSIQIGIDNLNDNDGGWSIVYEIKLKTVDGKVADVKIEGYAG